VRESVDAAAGEDFVHVFNAGDGIGVGAFAAEELGEGLHWFRSFVVGRALDSLSPDQLGLSSFFRSSGA
jgi:hypothetical protein